MLYTSSHEWILIEGASAKVGITDYAQKELGEIVYIDLPKVGQRVRQGEEVCVLESTKSAADIYAPVSGVITAINDLVRQTPSLLNRAPESAGWLFQIALSHPQEASQLLNSSEYKKSLFL